ncbi:hypothetical protein SISSUDRAFT_441637 [Sistotremastrum suecicum HHB10207 ss-3]|uniref:Uncharacterized protein n=1 Tax=Sistotremastrum suecicum HHB10207 ss-3 TaxID=1314776 RepID=A0A165YDF8_9AGAM|nr:hypothetical protein SISSUDRAFT_441637 [Sistotremastrum suecicum HHB10207 ss-3]
MLETTGAPEASSRMWLRWICCSGTWRRLRRRAWTKVRMTFSTASRGIWIWILTWTWTWICMEIAVLLAATCFFEFSLTDPPPFTAREILTEWKTQDLKFRADFVVTPA